LTQNEKDLLTMQWKRDVFATDNLLYIAYESCFNLLLIIGVTVVRVICFQQLVASSVKFSVLPPG